LLQKKHQELEDLAFALACKQVKDENQFLNEQETIQFLRVGSRESFYKKFP